jgi:hypothetical protein
MLECLYWSIAYSNRQEEDYCKDNSKQVYDSYNLISNLLIYLGIIYHPIAVLFIYLFINLIFHAMCYLIWKLFLSIRTRRTLRRIKITTYRQLNNPSRDTCSICLDDFHIDD